MVSYGSTIIIDELGGPETRFLLVLNELSYQLWIGSTLTNTDFSRGYLLSLVTFQSKALNFETFHFFKGRVSNILVPQGYLTFSILFLCSWCGNFFFFSHFATCICVTPWWSYPPLPPSSTFQMPKLTCSESEGDENVIKNKHPEQKVPSRYSTTWKDRAPSKLASKKRCHLEEEKKVIYLIEKKIKVEFFLRTHFEKRSFYAFFSSSSSSSELNSKWFFL